MERRKWLWCASVAVSLMACAQELPLPDPGSGPRDPSVAAFRPANTVTLITGDRVTVAATGETPSVTVQPGPGRDGIVFVTHVVHGDVVVIPDDVAPLIATGRLDRSRFDVTALLARRAAGGPPEAPEALAGIGAASGGGSGGEAPDPLDDATETFTVTARALDIDGNPASMSLFLFPIQPKDLFSSRLVEVTGEVSFALPRGMYTLEAFGRAPDFTYMIYPRFEVTGNTSVDLDRRLARPIAIQVAGDALEVIDGAWAYRDAANDIGFDIADVTSLPTAHLGPDAAPGEVFSWLQATLAAPGSGPSPTVLYQVGHAERDHFVTGWSASLQPEQLATVREHHAGQDGVTYAKSVEPLFQDTAGLRGIRRTSERFYVGPFDRTVHYYGPEFLWGERFDTFAPPDSRGRISSVVALTQAPLERLPGQRTVEHWNQAPFAPSFPLREDGIPNSLGGLTTTVPTATRSGDALTLEPSALSDAPVLRGDLSQVRHASTQSVDQRISLFRDGALVEQLINVELLFAITVPPEPATYRLEQEVARRAQDVVELSRHVSTAWTFGSQHVSGHAPQLLPLPTVRFLPDLDDHNRARHVHLLPAIVERPAGAATPRIAQISVEASFDDGATWSPVPAVSHDDRWFGLILAPRHARFVSLRATARDVEERRVEQTIVRAYSLK